MSFVSVTAIALSAMLIVIVGLGDPKRRRSVGNVADEQGGGVRRLLASIACLPGLYLAVTGDAAGFLIWLGGCSVIGWLLALILGNRARQSLLASNKSAQQRRERAS